MKRIASLIILAMLFSMVTGCAQKSQEEEGASADSYIEGEAAVGGGIIQGESNSSDQGASSGGNNSSDNGDSGENQNENQSQNQNQNQNQSQNQNQEDDSSDEKKDDSTDGSSDQSSEEPDSSTDEEPSVDSAPVSPEEELKNIFVAKSNNMGLNLKGKKGIQQGNCLSDEVSVKYGDSLTFGPVTPAQVVVGFAFDKNGKAVELINATLLKEEATFEGGMKIYTYAVPQNAAKVMLNVPSSVKEEFVIARNNTFSMKDFEKLAGVNSGYFSDCLYGKRGLFVGDSICVGSGGWASRLTLTGMEAVNNGVSGSSLSTARDLWIVNQILKSKDEDFDYVLIHGGVNDAWESAEVGVIADGFDPDEFDLSTYAGGLEWNLYNAVKYYGDTAAIGYLMNFKMPVAKPGRCADMSEYFDTAKQICKKWGITYFDMYNHKEITQELALTTEKHTYDTKNMVHISASGYDVITPYIEEYMRTMTPCNQKLLKEIVG